uniref:Ubiquitin-like protease family profile domain-containing protein n=1 Tax=Brassica campestris TaxID=3711 RepID=A0A3P6CT76_BRACM|nr:unnamed protein product [Brassica rapa]
MDVLIQYISLDRSRKMTLTSTPKIAFYDTNFPRSLMHHYGKLTKTAVKDRFKKDINPITIVVPHILNYTMGQQSNNGRKPFVITRPKEIPQNNNLTESAIMTVLLIQAHALNGIDGSQEVKEAHLAAAAKHLAVLIYRDINPA